MDGNFGASFCNNIVFVCTICIHLIRKEKIIANYRNLPLGILSRVAASRSSRSLQLENIRIYDGLFLSSDGGDSIQLFFRIYFTKKLTPLTLRHPCKFIILAIFYSENLKCYLSCTLTNRP